MQFSKRNHTLLLIVFLLSCPAFMLCNWGCKKLSFDNLDIDDIEIDMGYKTCEYFAFLNVVDSLTQNVIEVITVGDTKYHNIGGEGFLVSKKITVTKYNRCIDYHKNFMTINASGYHPKMIHITFARSVSNAKIYDIYMLPNEDPDPLPPQEPEQPPPP